jgi:uncharacterized protein (DUF885 family)
MNINGRILLLSAASLIALAACSKKAEREPVAAAGVETAADSPGAPAAEEDAAARFDAAVVELTKAYFGHVPEIATYYGAPADLAGADAASRLNARSVAANAERLAAMEGALATLKATDEGALDEPRRIVRTSLITLLDGALAPARIAKYGALFNVYGFWWTPYAILQNSGPIVDVANLMEAQHQVKTAADAEAYVNRLEAFGPMIDEVTAKLRHDVELGATPPDFVIEKCRNVIASFTGTPPAENVLAASFRKKLAEAKIEDAETLAARAEMLIAGSIYPAEERLFDYLGEIARSAPHDAGIWRLPDGEAVYKAMIRHMTDTDMTADQIHQIGLDEVARILSEMDAILRAEGQAEGTVGERIAKLAEEQRFFYPNTDEGKAKMLADIDAQLKRVNEIAPRWFKTLPEYGVEVRAVPAFSQESAPGGYYDAPALDGSRPGTYWINLRDTAIWPKFAVPTLTYHEAVPGHHFQVAIAMGTEQPLILNALSSNAYGEGWALYAETLAKEMGLYAGDPFGDLGRLQDELHRAIRLVVDTGMHAKRWSREQAMEYMATTEGIHPKETESEIERYAVWPGQALGYKIGMLKIEELRRNAETELGSAFDIREFHDEVLKAGGVPLPVLEANIERWIAAKRS